LGGTGDTKICPSVAAGDVHATTVEVIEQGEWNQPFLYRTGWGINYLDWDGIELKAHS